MFLAINLLISIFFLTSGEYFVKDKAVPSYLYRLFEDNQYKVFPNDIRIRLSLSKISGTLLYSIDKNDHQLIVSINDDAMEPRIRVEFNSQLNDTSMSDLCGCDHCRYEILELRVQIESHIYIQCNNRSLKIIKYEPSTKLNKKYPLPTISRQSNTAHLWLVNTYHYNDLYPNQDQLSGCIFNVWYDRRPLSFTNVSSNIERRCNKTCTDNICNGGQCYETYNGSPMCNCTMSFLSGRYCNESIHSQNARSISQTFKFDMFKVFWRSTVNDIFTIQNENVQIEIIRNDYILSFRYRYSNGYTDDVRGNLSITYVPNTESICIVHFNPRNVHIWTYNNMSWNSISLPTDRDLRYEEFTTLRLRSGLGIIGMVSKNSPKHFEWVNVTMNECAIITEEKIQENKTENTKTIGQWWIIGLSVIFNIIQLPLSIKFCYQNYLHKHRRTKVARERLKKVKPGLTRTPTNEQKYPLQMKEISNDRAI